MIIEVDKKYFIAIMATILVIAGGFFVISSYAGPNGVGHSAEEVEGLNLSEICMSDGTNCYVPDSCVLYEDVHSVTCPDGKYVARYNLKGLSTCVSLVDDLFCIFEGYYSASCPAEHYISNKATFGHLQNSCRSYSDDRYSGDILCC